MVVCDAEMMDTQGKRLEMQACSKKEPNWRFMDVEEETTELSQEENESWYKQLNVEHDVTVGNS